MATRVVYLVRHGQYKHLSYKGTNAHLTMDQINQLDGGLTDLGVRQAMFTARRLRALPITGMYCSTLPRALQTAEIIAETFPQVQLHRSVGLWECIPSVPPEFSHHFSDLRLEDRLQGKRRAAKIFEQYFKPARGEDKFEVIVCHGNLIRYLVCRALSVSPDAWLYMYTYNCGISQVLVRGEHEVRLVAYNDVGHLGLELISF